MKATMPSQVFRETSDVARELGVSAASVQLWTRLGLVTPLRTLGGRRLFTPEDVATLRALQVARRNRREKIAA